MNLEVRLCACGAKPDKGANSCPSCGAGLSALADADSPRALVEEDATVPVLAAASANDSGQTYQIGAVFGSYRLVKQIGAGGMGHVFIAEHTRLGRQVAVKILRSEYSNNREAVRRFFAEAQAVNRINHENIIEISDFIESPRGPSFYVMELLKGKDLRTVEDTAGVLPLRRALRIAVQVCRGLGAAHDAGVIHRDLKPENIFLIARDGHTDVVKLLDFGVAKLMNAALDDAATFKSVAGIVVGTPAYMAPEQAMADTVDHRADIYSVGVILFELATGQRPFVADSAREVMAKHMMTPAPRPNKLRALSPVIPQKLENLILACLKKDARDRPQSIKEVEQRLRDVMDDLPDEGKPIRFGRPVGNPRLWLGVAAGVTALAAIAALFLTAPRKERPAAASKQSPAATGVAPVPATATPKPRIEISFTSTPPGAAVFQAGTDHPLGVTPFSVGIEPSDQPQRFEFRRDGWQVGRRTVTLTGPGQVDIALAPLPPTASRRAPAATGKEPAGAAAKKAVPQQKAAVGPTTDPPPPRKLDSDVVLNPFE